MITYPYYIKSGSTGDVTNCSIPSQASSQTLTIQKTEAAIKQV